MDSLKNLFGGLSERFQSLSGTQRLLIPTVVAALLLALGFLLFMQGQEDYGVLFSNLSQEDAGGIVSKLKGQKSLLPPGSQRHHHFGAQVRDV